MKTPGIVAIMTVLTLALAGPAQAQLEADPGFMTLDRMDATQRLGLQVGLLKLDAVDLDDGFFVRPELYAQLMVPATSLGIYAQLPFTWMVVFDGDDRMANSNLELGAYYLLGGASSVILRGGLSLGIASDDIDSFANAVTTWERLTDVVGVFPDTSAVRLSASTLRHLSGLFFRADLGFDVLLDTPLDIEAIFRANLGIGARLPAVDLTAELVNVAGVGGDDSLTEAFLHTGSLGLRTRGATQFHLGMVFPLDEGIRGELWILSLGLHRAL